jgi:NAD(P)-dependent dehydrogenase (short-subunit alcohol dehydrogenase family)
MTGGPRVALVTGGAGALGQAVTLRLLADGLVAVVPWVVEAERERLLGRVPAGARDRLHVERADVTDAAAMTALADAVAARHGALDVLVAGVGGFAGGGLLETDLAAWRRMLDVNLTSAFVAMRAVTPHMVRGGGGRIVAVASRAVVPPAPGFVAYTVAKAGVLALVQAVAAEVKDRGVTVNAVLPSTMDTPANRAAMPDADPRRWVPVEAVADAIAFLVRAEAAHVTGTLLAI